MFWLIPIIAVGVGVAAAVGAAAVVAAVLYWSTVRDWLHGSRINKNDTIQLIKNSLDSGEYEVVGNVFNRSGNRKASCTWAAEELDDSLKAKFKGRKKIKVDPCHI